MRFVARDLLFVALIVGLGGVFFFGTRSASKPTPRVRPEAGRTLDGPATVETAQPERTPASPLATAMPPESSAAPAATENTTADTLAASMHALEDSNPSRALELARRGQQLWPSGPRAAEFAATEVKCLYRLGRPSEGRGAAEAMVNRYPTSPWALEVEKQTGAHPYVNH
jgi:hypothetical protein